ncbi:hypothetical protein [Paenibacillus sp. FSL H8-0034]|uniref:hypothetical protein n=1 Tax=Paenibacillus sp. FSL H8-0034 TaxID=2954671 RepID=UPI0030FA0DC8
MDNGIDVDLTDNNLKSIAFDIAPSVAFVFSTIAENPCTVMCLFMNLVAFVVAFGAAHATYGDSA